MQVETPIYGKKLWRVNRTSLPGAAKNSSRECLNSSLKISAAGKQFLQKRAPSKRPRSKPGQPKDFVFVDLSPVKSSDDESTFSCYSDFSAVSSSLSANTSVSSSPTAMSRNDSLSSNSYFEEEPEYPVAQCSEPLPEHELLGLGLLNLNYDLEAPQNITPQQQHDYQPMFATPIEAESTFCAPQYSTGLESTETFMPLDMQRPQLAPIQTEASYPSPEKTHRRARSVSTGSRRKSAGGIQFKTYKGPKNSQIQKVHKRCLSESHITYINNQRNIARNSLKSPLATPTESFDEFAAFIKELEQENIEVCEPQTQDWNEPSDLFLSNISDIPEYSENPSMNYDFDATAFTVF